MEKTPLQNEILSWVRVFLTIYSFLFNFKRKNGVGKKMP